MMFDEQNSTAQPMRINGEQKQNSFWSIGSWGWNRKDHNQNPHDHLQQHPPHGGNVVVGNSSANAAATVAATNDANFIVDIEGPEKIRSLPSVPPKNDPTLKSTDVMLAKYMNALSINEREVVLEELHGIGYISGVGYDKTESMELDTKEEMKDEAEGLSTALLPRQWPLVVNDELNQRRHLRRKNNKTLDEYYTELEFAIGQVPNKYAYDAAYAMDSSYVMNKEFLKLFLEADNYNVKHAATRIVLHFECKLDIFGPTKLVKDIAQDDLDEESLKLLYEGRFAAICNLRDAAGRLIGYCGKSKTDAKSKVKVVWYLGMKIATADPVTASRGVTIITTDFSNDPLYGNPLHDGPADRNEIWQICRAAQATPLKTGALHSCIADKKMSPTVALIISALEMTKAIRLRTHLGSFIEILHGLMSYGIPPDAMPIKVNGCEEIPPKGYINFLKYHKQREDEAMETVSSKMATMKNANNVISNRTNTCTQEQEEEDDSEELLFLKQLESYIDGGSNVNHTNILESFDPSSYDTDLPLEISTAQTTTLRHTTMPQSCTSGIAIPTPSSAMEELASPGQETESSTRQYRQQQQKYPQSNRTPLSKQASQQGENRFRQSPPQRPKQQRLAIPGPYDILLGKGHPLYRHQGNIYFRKVVELHSTKYRDATKQEKYEITKELAVSIKSSGVRFLKQDCNDDGWWIEVDDDIARDKISHTFRNLRLLSKSGSKTSASSSSSKPALYLGNDSSSDSSRCCGGDGCL